MSSNSLGEAFRITTFGESHGSMMGVVIDGVPSGLAISQDDINQELALRRPGRRLTSARMETDLARIESGIFDGRTTGAPIAITVNNVDVRSEPYEQIRFSPRPGHADLPYIMKYGLENWDYRGGGRSSARETVNWVSAGAVAKKLLCLAGIRVAACLGSLGTEEFQADSFDRCFESRRRPYRTPEDSYEQTVEKMLVSAIKNKDSLGGTVRVMVHGCPPGLGDPVFSKLKADLARAVMSTPGSVFFEMGQGILLSRSSGSEVMDSINYHGGRFSWSRNLHGGVLGGISTGDIIYFNAGFKPTSSIDRPHQTVDIRSNEPREIRIIGRHDPAIVIRAVPVMEAIAAVVIVDHMIKGGFLPRKLDSKDRTIIDENWKKYRIPEKAYINDD
ncbi:MAG: chorismate synthase [Thermoplasmataceae archaeon]